MKRAALYCRVSTDEQARHGLSIENQLETLREYANKNNYEVVGEYIDEGVSGQKGYKKRPALNKLMQELDNVDIILFIRLDRWFRSVRLYYEAQDILDAHGVKWNAILESYSTSDSAGMFVTNVLLSVSQAEAQRTGEKIRDIFERKKAKGEVCSGKTGLGIKIVDKKIAVDEENADKVRDIFRKYVELKSRTALCKYVANTYDLQYSFAGLRYLLANYKYVELGIIDPELFVEVQNISARRAARSPQHDHKPNQTHLFTGIFFCAECGYGMRLTYNHGWATYSCSKHARFGDAGCRNKHGITQRSLENTLKERLISAAEQYNVDCSTRSNKAVKLNSNAIKGKIKRLQDLYINEMIELADYKAQYEVLQKQLKEAEKSENIPQPLDLDAVKNLANAYDELSPENRKKFWNRIVKRITFDADKNIEFELETAKMMSLM